MFAGFAIIAGGASGSGFFVFFGGLVVGSVPIVGLIESAALKNDPRTHAD